MTIPGMEYNVTHKNEARKGLWPECGSREKEEIKLKTQQIEKNEHSRIEGWAREIFQYLIKLVENQANTRQY